MSLTAMTATVLLCSVLGMLQPWNKLAEKTLLAIYGAASAVGVYAVQLATRSGIHSLMCVAGKGVEFVEGLIDRIAEDVVVDYRKPSLVEDIRAALPEGQKLMFALDTVSGKGSYGNICKMLSTDGGEVGDGATSGSWGREDSRGDYGGAGTGGVGF